MIHQKLASGRWFNLSLAEQMANIGSEVHRSLYSDNKPAFERALELFDLTLADPKNLRRLKEVARLREAFVDYRYENRYSTTKKFWESYFYQFNYLARNRRRA